MLTAATSFLGVASTVRPAFGLQWLRNLWPKRRALSRILESMALEGDEWEIPIPELAERIGNAERYSQQSPRDWGQDKVIALRTILDARVQLEAAQQLGVAAVRADRAAIEAAEATKQAAEATEGTRKATVWLAVATTLLFLAAAASILVELGLIAKP